MPDKDVLVRGRERENQWTWKERKRKGRQLVVLSLLLC